MNPARIDLVVDLTYGVLIFVAVILVIVVETSIGAAFGVGVLVSYLVHVGWKMSKFDPDWMSGEVAERVEETVSEEIEQTVEDTVSKEVDAAVERAWETLGVEVSETVKQTVSEEMEAFIAGAEDAPGGADGRGRSGGRRIDQDRDARGRRYLHRPCSVCTTRFVPNINKEPTHIWITGHHLSDGLMLRVQHS